MQKISAGMLVRSVSLTLGLFLFHTAVLFESALGANFVADLLNRHFNIHVAGTATVMLAFFVLYVAHVAEAAVWACFIHHYRLLPGYYESFYYSLTAMTTLGFGDVVLKERFRMLGPLLAASGLLMFGCSTAFLFLVIQQVWHHIPDTARLLGN